MAKNEIVTTEEKTTAVTEVNPSPELYVAVDPADMMVPFLKVIQSLSEEVMPGKDKYNPDVRPGDIYDSVTRTILRDAKVIICGLKKYYAEWTPEVRGTLVGKHASDSPVVQNAERIEKKTDKGASYYTLRSQAGNDLIETYGVVMIVKNDDGVTLPAVLTLSKTSFAVGKQLTMILALHQVKGVPIFRLSTTNVSNTKGSWFKPSFAYDSYETDSSIISMAQGLAGNVDKILFSSPSTDDSTQNVPSLDDELL